MITLRQALLITVVLAASPAVAQDRDVRRERVEREVFHQLVLLPYYGVFDHLAFKAEPGGRIVLLGAVTRPTLKSDAERVVKDVEGVEQVVNEIEVLPTSPNDDRIRLAAYRAIFAQTALQTYALRAVPSIHIVVKNGNVTLEGSVARQMDKTVADHAARGVEGAFTVKNNLQVETR